MVETVTRGRAVLAAVGIAADDDGMTADAALLAAEREFRRWVAEAGTEEDDDARGRLLGKSSLQRDFMAETPATTLVGAAAKMRVLLDPDVGIESGAGGNDLPILRDVLALLERLAGDA